jgi:tyrosyl-tRNA synthetase
MKQDIAKVLQVIKSGAHAVIPEDDLIKKLESGKKLKIKLGMDPTSPDLHLGHAVVLSKLRQFQDLGHEVIFLIGNFTARIGDPTGKSKTRPPLSEKEIEDNTRTYFAQVSRILDPDRVSVVYNAEWLDRLAIKDFVQICARTTVARIIEREDFATRLKDRQPIAFHELLYPIFQAYDSVALFADVELGGTDQTFNLMLGRYLQEQFHQPAQVIITMPILEGLDGVQKMSKSLGNAIGLNEPADQAYGKLMSISDMLMWRYSKLLLQTSDDELARLQALVDRGDLHPMAVKKQIAYDIVAKYWSPDQADHGQEKFEALFQNKDYSKAEQIVFPIDVPNPAWIVDILKHLGSIKTSSEAKRLIDSGAVSIDDEVISDFKAYVNWKPGMVIKVGKHRIYMIKG